MDSRQTRVLIRTATAGDLDGLAVSSAGLSDEDGATRDALRDPNWPRLHAAQAYAHNLADPNMLVLVADDDGEVAGHLLGAYYSASTMWLAPRAHLISLYVRPPWRGRSVGSQLVTEFTAWARNRGAAQLRVTAYTANQGAIRFYQRHGFAALESTFAADLGV